ncbi:hypothetical protein K469DRAFT_727021 [Zopfia rhizophila CBS 207.26]|uniref:Uncharacterized protein n=1 Tax=Zopfia rhizophila CBS 207.26 TaxID=1314779 RepID=A0A6A6DYN6_9PEZI|nr:hypothetical protein K469DRAFT_727021 [Zopfia rhizophila CBS 207.26]
MDSRLHTGLVNLQQVYRYTLGSKDRGRGSAIIATITQIQKRAAQIITRAFKTTTRATIDVEAYLLPALQQLEQTSLEATIRIRTTPLYEEIIRPKNNNMAQSPLNRFLSILESKFNIHLDRLEKRQQHDAIRQHNATEIGTLCIYTNRNSINGHVSAAVIVPALQLQGCRTKRTEYIGKAATSTVYTVELRGIKLVFQIALDCTVFTDNQATIQAMAKPKCPSKQYILVKAILALDKL